MLYSELKHYEVTIPLGEKLGNFKGMVIDDEWNVKEIIVSPGVLKENIAYKIEDVEDIDEEEKKIIVVGTAKENPVPEHSTRTRMLTEDLIDKKVISKDGEKVGKLYDLVALPMPTQANKIWKVLISRGLRERRLRLSPSQIKEIEEEIVLDMDFDKL